jgi:hypothetical protein
MNEEAIARVGPQRHAQYSVASQQIGIRNELAQDIRNIFSHRHLATCTVGITCDLRCNALLIRQLTYAVNGRVLKLRFFVALT